MVYQGPSPEPTLPPAVAGPAFLPDGTEVWVRPAHPSDGELLREFVGQESPETLELRTFSSIRPLLAREEVVAPSSPEEHLCLLVLGDRSDRVAVLGVGEYRRTRAGSSIAEVAFLVAGSFRGRGIPTLLLARLARAARAFGILRFEARVQTENPEMLEVFRGSGLPFSEESYEGEVDVLFPVGPEAGGSSSMAVGPAFPEEGPGATPAAGGAARSLAARPRPSALRSRA